MRNFAHIFTLGIIVIMGLITWFVCCVGDYFTALGSYYEYAAVALSWLCAAMWIAAIYLIAYLQVHRNTKEAKF